MKKREGKLTRIHAPELSWSEIEYTRSFLTNAAISSSDRVCLTWLSASASTFAPPHMHTQSGSSDASVALISAADPLLRGSSSAARP